MTYSKEYIDRAEEVILHTYNRFQIVLDKGNGVHLYDVDGKEYLDFAAGIAVFALGYNNQAYNQALKDQIDKVIHTSNLYYNVPMMEAAEKLVKATGLSKVFFTNSGTEAIEGAIKVARKYAYLKDGSNDHEIIAMNHSFPRSRRSSHHVRYYCGYERRLYPADRYAGRYLQRATKRFRCRFYR